MLMMGRIRPEDEFYESIGVLQMLRNVSYWPQPEDVKEFRLG